MNRHLATKMLFVGTSLFITSACKTSGAANSALKDSEPTFGGANPASVYCEAQGGRNVSEGGDSGSSFCAFGDSLIEEWTLYRYNHRQPGDVISQAVDNYLNPKATGPLIGNPASSYCANLGGTNANFTDDQGQEWDYCEFGDNSQIDVWTLLRGPDHPSHAQFTAVLRQGDAQPVIGVKTISPYDNINLVTLLSLAGAPRKNIGASIEQNAAKIHCSRPVVPNAQATCQVDHELGTKVLSAVASKYMIELLERNNARRSGEDVFGAYWREAANVKCAMPNVSSITTCTFK